MYGSVVILNLSGTCPICRPFASESEENNGEETVWKNKWKSARGNKGRSAPHFGLPFLEFEKALDTCAVSSK